MYSTERVGDQTCVRVPSQNSAHDVVVEVLVGRQAQHETLLGTSGEQAVAYAGRIAAFFVLSTHLLATPGPVAEVTIDLGPMAEVVADDRIHVGQSERRVLLHDLFRRRSLTESGDNRVQRDAGGPNAHHAVRVRRERDGFWIDSQQRCTDLPRLYCS